MIGSSIKRTADALGMENWASAGLLVTPAALFVTTVVRLAKIRPLVTLRN
jgi:hypothetical protein